MDARGSGSALIRAAIRRTIAGSAFAGTWASGAKGTRFTPAVKYDSGSSFYTRTIR
jgi:hypothetical protein